MKNSCIRPDLSDILPLRKASEKMHIHGKGVIKLSHNTLSRGSNPNCLRAILPSENLPCADAARAHTQASVIFYLGMQAAYVLTV